MEDYEVTQIGEGWSKMMHRQAKIKRCANGYIVEYQRVSGQEKGTYGDGTVQETRVFLTNTDLLEFIEKYFQGEPRP